jgi:hypothetical protein
VPDLRRYHSAPSVQALFRSEGSKHGGLAMIALGLSVAVTGRTK